MLCQILWSFPLKYISWERADDNYTSKGSGCCYSTLVPGYLKAGSSPGTHDSCQTQKSQRVLEPCACAMFPPAGRGCHVISSLNLPILVMEITGRERVER